MIVRAGVGVNFREPPDEIGRVGISVVIFMLVSRVGFRKTFHSNSTWLSLVMKTLHKL